MGRRGGRHDRVRIEANMCRVAFTGRAAARRGMRARGIRPLPRPLLPRPGMCPERTAQARALLDTPQGATLLDLLAIRPCANG